jgi:protein SCO1/2
MCAMPEVSTLPFNCRTSSALSPWVHRLRTVVAGVATVVCVGGSIAQGVPPDVAAATPLGLDPTVALQRSQSVIGKSVDDFTLLDRDGQPVRLSKYRGKPLLVSFIYTGCFQVCPTTTRSLQTAIEAGRGAFGVDQFNVVSIGFNQPADSPQSLKAFARQYRIDAPNWDFLSPNASIVEALTRQFGFSFVATPAGFDHTLQATLLDAQGRIYRQIYGDAISANAIGEPLRQLLDKTPVTEKLQLQGLVDRVRILCTIYNPKTGQYEVQYGLVIEIAGGITFFMAMLWFFAAEWFNQRRMRRGR